MPLRRRNKRGLVHLREMPHQSEPQVTNKRVRSIDMLGRPYSSLIDVDIVAIRCPDCHLLIDAEEWPDHTDCPARAEEG